MNNILDSGVMDISIPYYDDNSRYSNSSIGYYLNNGIRYYYEKVNGILPPLSTSSLVKGTMIHKYVLEYEDFYNEYTMSASYNPSSAQQKAYTDYFVDAKITSDLIEDKYLIEAYRKNYAAEKMSDEKVIEKSKDMFNTYAEAIDIRVNTGDKITVSPTEMNSLHTIRKNIQRKPLAEALINPDTTDKEIHTEFHINWEDEASGALCKSLIDRLIIDHATKTIYLVDLKTTFSITEFRSSMEKYGYFRQLAFYTRAIQWYVKNCRPELKDYKISRYIVAISTNPDTLNEVRVFRFEEEDFVIYNKDIDYALHELEWHRINNKYEMSKHCYEFGYDLLC